MRDGVDKEFVRERGRALIKQIEDELHIDGKVSLDDETTRMGVFHRITELVEKEQSKLTGPEQHLVREYAREGILQTTDPDRWLDLQCVEDVDKSLAEHEYASFKYGSLYDKLLFCAIPQEHAKKTLMQQLVGIFFLIACTLLTILAPVIVIGWLMMVRAIHYPIFSSFIVHLGGWVGVSTFVVIYFFMHTSLVFALRRIDKKNKAEYKKIMDRRHSG